MTRINQEIGEMRNEETGYRISLETNFKIKCIY
jgi:hypothetical protein